MGSRHSAPSAPSIRPAGAAIGVGIIPALLPLSLSRNSSITNASIRRALIGSPSAEAPGSIGPVLPFPIPYAFYDVPRDANYSWITELIQSFPGYSSILPF